MTNQIKTNIIIYNTADGKASVSLLAKDGTTWLSQSQIAELFATTVNGQDLEELKQRKKR